MIKAGNRDMMRPLDGHGTTGDVRWVTLCGVTAAVQSVAGRTQIVVRAGADGFGLGDVRVQSTEYGLTVRSNAFTYLSAPSPILRIRGINGALIANLASVSTVAGMTDLAPTTTELAVTNPFSPEGLKFYRLGVRLP